MNCRINVYWASQHYGELAKIRERQGLAPAAATPPFLIGVHQSALEERIPHGGREEHKVRRIARAVMRGKPREGTDERTDEVTDPIP